MLTKIILTFSKTYSVYSDFEFKQYCIKFITIHLCISFYFILLAPLLAWL